VLHELERRCVGNAGRVEIFIHSTKQSLHFPNDEVVIDSLEDRGSTHGSIWCWNEARLPYTVLNGLEIRYTQLRERLLYDIAVVYATAENGVVM
jgi:hypothetical protein